MSPIWLAVFLPLAYYLYKRFLIVLPHHVCVVFRQGSEPKILKPGLHFLINPLDQLAEVNWHCRVQDNEKGESTEIVITHQINTENQSLDVVPMFGLTKENVDVCLDGTLHYKIEDPILAVTKTPNLLGYLTDVVGAATQKVLCELSYTGVKGKNTEISNMMTKAINTELKPYGAVCTKFYVQSINMDEVIQKSMEKQISSERNMNVEKAARKHEQDLILQDSMFELQKEEKRSELERIKRENEIKQAKIDIELENLKYERDMISHRGKIYPERELNNARLDFLKNLNDAGYTKQEASMIYAIPFMESSAKKTDKWIISSDSQGLSNLFIPNMISNKNESYK